jgi:hypothetical protein
MPLTDAEKIAQMTKAFRYVALADRTTYEHHEKRPRDGKRPEEIGGTIWLTPREVALDVLKGLGEEIESLYWPFRAPPSASGGKGDGSGDDGGSETP